MSACEDVSWSVAVARGPHSAGVSLVRELDSLVRFEEMPIENHTRLGSCEILEPIGAGGMG